MGGSRRFRGIDQGSRLHLFRDSTVAFFREGRRTPGFTRFDALHGYVYARWPYLYIGIAVGEHPLARIFKPPVALVTSLIRRLRRAVSGSPGQPASSGTTAEGYHGKILPLESASRLVTINEEVVLKDLEHVIPYSKARDIVLQNPDHLVALECPCRASRAHPCLPLAVCLIVGEPFASFVVEHHPRRARWISRQEALQVLKDEHARGHVHHAFFKDAMLGRFYAICNCCRCCCGAMQAHRHGTPMIASSGYVNTVVEALCTGCGTCVEVCPFGALELRASLACVDTDACMGCGVCVSACDQEALRLVRDASKSEPLIIEELVRGAI